MAYIGLDLGSSYTKIALVSGGKVMREQRLATPPGERRAEQRYEVDAEDYWQQIYGLLCDYAAEGAEGILLSTQMHGYVLTDADFRPLTPYVSWQDGLGKKHFAECCQAFDAAAVEPSGVPLKPNLALCALWARQCEGETIPAGARLCTLGGYIIGRLTGRHVCHMTNAAPTGLADVRGGGWNRPTIERAGLGALMLPEIALTPEPVGTWRGIPVYPDMGDQQVCAAGAGLTQAGRLHVSVGTAGLIGLLTEEWGSGAYENRPWLWPGRYLRTVSGLPGGRNVAALKDEMARSLPQAVPEDAMWRMMTTLDAAHLPCEAPWQAQHVAACYRQMAEDYRRGAAQLEKRVTSLAFSGGCARKNDTLRRMISEALSAPASQADHDVMAGFEAIIAQMEEERP